MGLRTERRSPNVRSQVNLRRLGNVRSWPVGDHVGAPTGESMKALHLCLLGDLQRMVHFDPEVTAALRQISRRKVGDRDKHKKACIAASASSV
jgi:hypothetical protein